MDNNHPAVKEQYKQMYNEATSSDCSDVEFSVVNSKGKTVTISAHKQVLAFGSPVFKAMFYGKLPELGRTISLPDCTANGLWELFRYIYHEEVKLTGSNVMDVHYLAKKYLVPLLLKKCTEFLEKTLGPEDVFFVLQDAKQQGDEELLSVCLSVCWRIIDTETYLAVTSDSFLTVTQETLCDIIERDTLMFIKEVDLFKAVNRWAEHEMQDSQGGGDRGLHKRRVLGERAIKLLRFPLMTRNEFGKYVLSTGVLNHYEINEMQKYYRSGGRILTPGIFKSESRSRLRHVEDACKRFQSIGCGWSNCPGNKEDSIVFNTDKLIFLTGVRLFGHPGSEYTVKLSIYYKGQQLFDTKEQLYRSEEYATEGYHGYTIYLDHAVRVTPDNDYVITALVKGPISDFGQNGAPTVKCEKVTFHFKEKQNTNYRTTEKQGQFPEIMFYQIY